MTFGAQREAFGSSSAGMLAVCMALPATFTRHTCSEWRRPVCMGLDPRAIRFAFRGWGADW